MTGVRTGIAEAQTRANKWFGPDRKEWRERVKILSSQLGHLGEHEQSIKESIERLEKQLRSQHAYHTSRLNEQARTRSDEGKAEALGMFGMGLKIAGEMVMAGMFSPGVKR